MKKEKLERAIMHKDALIKEMNNIIKEKNEIIDASLDSITSLLVQLLEYEKAEEPKATKVIEPVDKQEDKYNPFLIITKPLFDSFMKVAVELNYQLKLTELSTAYLQKEAYILIEILNIEYPKWREHNLPWLKGRDI